MADYSWTSAGLIQYPLISSVATSPNGEQIAFAVRVAHVTDDASEFRRQIWLADRHDQRSPRLLAFGESADQPRWSPDGQYIAFLRKTPEKGLAGVWVMPAGGGEPWPVTGADNTHGSVTKFSWSPDGARIGFLATPIDDAKDQRIRQRDDVVHWRVDFDFAQLFVSEVSAPGRQSAAPIQLTFGRRHVTSLAWSPDGESIAYTHQANTLDDSWKTLRLAMVPSGRETDEPQQPRDLGPVTCRETSPAFSPDGRWVACEAGLGEGRWPYAGGVSLFALADGSARPLAPVSDEQPALIGWDSEGTGVYVLNHTGIQSEIAFLPFNGEPAVVVCTPNKLITAVHLNRQDLLSLVMEDFHEPQTVYSLHLSGANSVKAVHVARPEPSPSEGPLPQIRHLTWRTPDDLDIDGILYLPEGYDQETDGTLPLLLHVHGGPMSIFQRQYAATPYYYTPAALCERGIAVLRCNPRGSGGYGKKFRSANVRDWGGGDYLELQQGVDLVIDMGIADPDRLGIAGWSYGGYMTSWTITQTHRFKAASIGAAVTNPMSFCGTSDLPSFMLDYFGGEAWEIPEFFREHSPITYVGNVKTPAIIQHGGADERVPLEQGLQYFNAMQRRGVPVDMYIYPRQGHAIDEPRLLADAIERNLDWFTSMLVNSNPT